MVTAQFDCKDRAKAVAIVALYALSLFIIASGLAFGVYAWINHVNYTVLNSEIPGIFLAAIIIFLGIRYFRSMRKMSKTLKSSHEPFRWSNFRKANSAKKLEG